MTLFAADSIFHDGVLAGNGVDPLWMVGAGYAVDAADVGGNDGVAPFRWRVPRR
jgi:hypothetical protein